MNIAIGTAQFGLDYGISNINGQTSQDEANKILKYAYSIGIDCIDTAREYGDSEHIIGQILQDMRNDAFKITTKIGKLANVREDVQASLSMLNVKSLYGVMIHNTDVLFGNKGKQVFKELMQFKHDGKIRKVGVSVYTPDEMEKILNNFEIDMVQLPSSILDQRFVISGMLEKMKNLNIEIHIRSIFLQGLYCMDIEHIPEFLKPIQKDLLNVERIAKALEISKAKLAIEYAKSLNVDKIVVGINNLQQLSDIYNEYASKEVDIDFSFLASDNYLIDPRNWIVE